MKTGIALIGFMGTGKTAVGKLLAARTGKEFIELDGVIEAQAGMTIPDIFRKEGETGFREREIAAVKSISGKKNVVIACGGGAVLNTINTDRLRQECRIVCLTASPEAILQRTGQDGETRPLLSKCDRAATVRELLQQRRPFYQLAADVTVNTTRRRPEAVVTVILDKLKGA